ncbi:unnamed protein product, partial [Rotaria sp. Silwood2]
MEFFNNDPANPDCLDGSDESGRFLCLEDPTMRCEDRSSRLGYIPYVGAFIFNCGDGNPGSIVKKAGCTYVQPKFVPLTHLNLLLTTSSHCPAVDMLFNSTIMTLSIIGRMKYYYNLCHERNDLQCFHDEVHMCLCSNERHANCVEFDHNMTYNCYGWSNCENGAQCFQDHPLCPSSRICVCNDCFYGSRCQFSTKGFGLSLDVILGYQIRPYVTFSRQPIALKVSIVVTIIMFVLGFVNNTISIVTFQGAKMRETGCGLYLLFSSIMSTFTTVSFTLKFWLVVLAQKGTITNRSYLTFSCTLMDIILQVFVSSSEWLNAAVFVERAFTVIKGVHFDKVKSKRVAKMIILVLLVFIILTNIHDPLHRRLIDDIEESRTWCIVSYPNGVQLFNLTIKMFHFLLPFAFNLACAAIIIITISRNRFTVTKQTTYAEHLRKQLREHQHLLISPVALILLNLPRLIIYFTSS